MRAEIQNHVDAITKSLALLSQRMDWETAAHRLEEFNAMIEAPDLWNDPAKAQKLMKERQGLIDAISYVVFFFPSFLVLAIIGWHEADYAFRIHETSDQTPWRPILWPFKAIIPAACILLIIQGFSELLKSLYMARTGVELEHKEKVEV